MKNTEKKIDDFADSIWDFMEEIPDEDRIYAAQLIIRNTLFAGTDSHLESLGLLECVKLALREEFNEEHENERLRNRSTMN